MRNSDPAGRGSAKPAAGRSAPQRGMSCADARAAIREFLHGGMSTARANDLRAHRKQCTECDTEYRELVQGVAAISGGARTVAARATERFGEERVRRSLLAADPERKLRVPRFFLPIAVGVVFVVLAMRTGAPHARLVVETGEVWVKSAQIEHRDPVDLHRFDTCVTGADGRARIECAEDRLVLEPTSSCLIDRTDGLAVRLFEGTADVAGNARLLLPLGAVEAHGAAARVTIDEHGFTVACMRGDVVYQDGAAPRAVRPGSDLRIETTPVDPETGSDPAGVLDGSAAPSAPGDASTTR